MTKTIEASENRFDHVSAALNCNCIFQKHIYNSKLAQTLKVNIINIINIINFRIVFRDKKLMASFVIMIGVKSIT